MDPMGLYMTGIIVQTIRISRCPSQAAATHVPASEGPNYAALAASGPFSKKKQYHQNAKHRLTRMNVHIVCMYVCIYI